MSAPTLTRRTAGSVVQLRAVARFVPSHDPGEPVRPIPGEDPVEAGRRAYSHKMVRWADLETAPLSDLPVSLDDLYARVRELAEMIIAFDGATCGHVLSPGETVTTPLAPFGCNEECSHRPRHRCALPVIMDCQACARGWDWHLLPEDCVCAQCGAEGPGWLVILGVDQVNVVVHVCGRCSPKA